MTPTELQKILKGDKKLSVKQVKEIIFELKQDCIEAKDKEESLSHKHGYYNGEVNAFYICLDLLEKVKDN